MLSEICLRFLWHLDLPLRDLVLVTDIHLVLDGLVELGVGHTVDHDQVFLRLAVDHQLVEAQRVADRELKPVALLHVRMPGEEHIRAVYSPCGNLRVAFELTIRDGRFVFVDVCLEVMSGIRYPDL